MTAFAVIFIMVPGFEVSIWVSEICEKWDYNIDSVQITTGILIGAAALFAGIAAVGGLTASEQYDTWNFAELV